VVLDIEDTGLEVTIKDAAFWERLVRVGF